MLVSKPPSKLAYAKLCHQRSASALTSSYNLSGCQTPQHSKENIVDELITHMTPDQTSYLNQLIEKQEKRNKKGTKDKTKDRGMDSFRDKTNKCKETSEDRKCLKMKNSKISNKDISSSRKIRRTAKEKLTFMQPPTTKEKLQQSQIHLPLTETALKSTQNNSFIDNIQGYLAALADPRPRPSEKHNFQSHHTPETTQISQEDELRCQDQILASQSQFQELTIELRQALEANEILEQALQQKEQQISEMKSIIKNLCSEVTTLKDRLVNQYKAKKNYESIYFQFTHQMEKAKSNSRPKSKQKQHSSHTNLQRYSDGSRNMQREFNPRMSEIPHFRNTFDYSQINKFKEEQYGLKKKGKTNKYKLYNIRNSCLEETPTSEQWVAYPHQY